MKHAKSCHRHPIRWKLTLAGVGVLLILCLGRRARPGQSTFVREVPRANLAHAHRPAEAPPGDATLARTAREQLSGAVQERLRRTYATLPLSFEANLGQTVPKVKFLSRGNGYGLFLSSTEAVLRLRKPAAPGETDSQPAAATPATLRMKLAGANRAPQVEGLDELPGKSNYFIGNDPTKWRTSIPSYAKVKYRDVYPGVDLVCYGNQRQLEYDFVIAPGADAGRIRLAFEGAEEMRIDDSGDLVLRIAGTEIRQYRPAVYQEVDGRKHFLPGRYVLRGSRAVGFAVAGYERDKALVIDPVLAYSTFLGGGGLDNAHAVAVDQAGNVYLTGETISVNFPTQSPLQPANGGGSDAFVVKLDPTGATILYSTYLGGSGNENDFRTGVDSSSIAVDSAGNIYVTGRTSSLNFPVMNAVLPSYRGGDYDAFVSKLSADGSALLYSTYLGGDANDAGNGIAVDSTGNIYVTGGTRSDDFPISANAFQVSLNGQLDAYVTKIDPTQIGGASLIYSTYLGGLGIDRGTAIAVDSAGNAYVTGRTESPDFPTRNALQGTYGGAADAFVAKLNSGGTDLIYSTFLGGSGLDVGNGIAVDTAGNVYVTGETASPNFPTQHAYQAALGGSSDAFVAQLDSTGTVLVYSTFLGGTGLDRGHSIALDSTGKVYVAGETSSGNFPTVSPFQPVSGGGKDAFVAKLDPSQTGTPSVVYSSYLGGSGDDVGFGIAVNSAGDAWVAGQTASALTFPTVNPVQPTFGGGPSDAFVARVSSAGATPDYAVSASPPSRTVPPGSPTTYSVTVTPTGGFTGTVSLVVSGLPTDANGSFNPSSVVITDTTPKSSTLTVTTAATTPLGTSSLTITGSSGALQHSASVSLTVANATGPADLALTKTGQPNPVPVLTNLTYGVNVINKGPSIATGVTVTDTLPAGVTFVSATVTPSGAGTCSGTSTVTCDLGTMGVGTGAGVAVVIIVRPQAPGQISNTATVGGNEPDPDPTNNSATAVVTAEIPCPSPDPCMVDPSLSVRTVVSGLNEPTGIAFLGPDDFFVIEKLTGQVKHVVGGVVQSIVLDLAVNNFSERGLLGIALHPDFANNGFVYLYWTCRGPGGGPDCDNLFGEDTSEAALVPLRGNRVDRFIWDGSTLTFDQNLIRLHSYQADADANGVFNQPLRGNHNGGKIVFGPDGKLYILIGDNGRRGNMQNIANGVLPDGHDDQFGGPEADNNHFTGVIIRLNDDGTTPPDNPFFDFGAQTGGEVGANYQRIFAYGVRNSFGMAFDPFTGNLWTEENGDDSFDEINLVGAGFNGGWVQIMGPSSRIADFKGIETSPQYFGLQQVRWPPTLIKDTPEDAIASLFMLPGAVYTEPLFSWKYAVAPSPIGFVNGPGLGMQYQGDLIVGAARTFLDGGYLFDFKLIADRSDLDLSADPRLADRVADNVDKFDLTESESLRFGKNFGITTDIQTAPNGNLWVVSLTNSAGVGGFGHGAVYEILVSGQAPRQSLP